MDDKTDEPLSTRQLQEALRKHLPANIFGGVWARNHLDYISPECFPTALVINTDDAHQPGKHWTVFVCESPGSITFFDSFGCSPETYGEAFQRFVKNQQVTYHSKWVQGLNSVMSGHYCLYFLCHRFHVPSPRALCVFGQVYICNDQLVYQWTKEHFPQMKYYDEPGMQTCQCLMTI